MILPPYGVKIAPGAAEATAMPTPVVRVRFLVALVVLFGALASAAGAVAVQQHERADDAETVLDALEVVHRGEWPEGVRPVDEVRGCVAGARKVCLASDHPPRETSELVAQRLGIGPEGVRERTEGPGTYDVHGAVAGAPVIAWVDTADPKDRDDDESVVDLYVVTPGDDDLRAAD